MLTRRVAITAFFVFALAMPASALTLPELLRAPAPEDQSLIPTPVQSCCKHCTVGKACGDTCIARDKTCHVGPGCACDG
jgi:hypothetical protein